jgi:hypothetical protein
MRKMLAIIASLFCLNGFAAAAPVLQDTIPSIGATSLPPVLSDSAPFRPFNLYDKPKKWGFVTHLPSDLWQLAKSPFKKQNLPGLAVVAGSTALLIWQDQALLNGAKQLGDNIHLERETGYKVLLKAGESKVLKIPTNLNTALYQMGEGGTSMLIAGGLFLYGKIDHDYRALQTASDLTEGFLMMGFSTQVLKRISGRQSPFMSTRKGGKWSPFPSFADYQTNTSNYDAFPSGHLATMMCTVTILAENYPEKKWIRPLGYSLISMVGFAMMNTEVHWAGDYPLAIALGYVSGKIVTGRHKRKHKILPGMY